MIAPIVRFDAARKCPGCGWRVQGPPCDREPGCEARRNERAPSRPLSALEAHRARRAEPRHGDEPRLSDEPRTLDAPVAVREAALAARDVRIGRIPKPAAVIELPRSRRELI